MRPLAVVLAAGASRRMGRPKALLPIDGIPLVLAHVRALRARCGDVRVVLGAGGDAIAATLADEAEPCWNPDWASTGPLDSLHRALHGLDPGDWVLVAPVDTPPAPPAVLDALLAAGPPAVPVWAGNEGHPVLVTAGAARAATGSLRDALSAAARVPVDWPETVRNLNTPADWRSWRGARG